jgi:MFS family permease
MGAVLEVVAHDGALHGHHPRYGSDPESCRPIVHRLRVHVDSADHHGRHRFISDGHHGSTWWIVNRLAFLVGTTNLSGFAVYFLQGRLGYAEEKAAGPAAQLMMVVGVFILLSALPSGWLADRFGPKRLVAVSGGLAVLGTLIIILTTNMSLIYVGGCLIGVATGVFFTANWALGTELVPKEEAGRYLGISNLAGAGAGAVGAYIGGPIADFFTVHVPEAPGIGYVVLFAIYGMMFLLSVISLRGIQEKGAQTSK